MPLTEEERHRLDELRAKIASAGAYISTVLTFPYFLNHKKVDKVILKKLPVWIEEFKKLKAKQLGEVIAT